jgi:hypothetical protein
LTVGITGTARLCRPRPALAGAPPQAGRGPGGPALFENEVAAIVALRRKGRTFSYIAEEIGVCRDVIGRDVIGRELRARGIATSHIKADRRARRGRGFWRCFD